MEYKAHHYHADVTARKLRLIVREARIDGGPMMKRIHARARGMAYMVKKRLAHIHISVADESEQETQVQE